MHGNVREWVQDWYDSDYYAYDSDYYASGPEKDPLNGAGGSHRVLRGGSWYNSAGYCRSADRNYDSPGYRYGYNGFRLALSPGQQR